MSTETLKILGQSVPSVTTLTDVYTVPASTSTSVSSIVVCNQNATAINFRISLAVAGLANTAKQYLYYDVPVAGNDTFIATIGITLGAADVIRVYSDTANVSFSMFGAEIS